MRTHWRNCLTTHLVDNVKHIRSVLRSEIDFKEQNQKHMNVSEIDPTVSWQRNKEGWNHMENNF